MSIKQKINTRSSTEAELVAADDIAGLLLWSREFLRDQGYDYDVTLYQDNQSTKILLENGKASSSKRTRHINIKYYFLTDRISNKELSVVYCPTEEMIADYFSKPLQGQKFIKFRNMVLNIDQE